MEAVQTQPTPPSFETVWAILQEVGKKQEELVESQKETARHIEETDRILKENSERLDRKMARVSKQMGDLHNRFGEMAEHLVAPSIEERFNELGFHFSAVAPGGYKVLAPQPGPQGAEPELRGSPLAEKRKVVAQVDILLLNSDYIMAVEIKAKVHTKDIEQHVKRLELLRKYWEKKDDKRVIQGAIAGAIFGNMEKKAAIEAGLYVLVQSGDTMKLELPDGFVPREW